MKMRAEKWDAHVSAMLAEACADAKDGDTFSGSFVISNIIEKLKTGESLSALLAEYLAEALEQCMADPVNAGKALRLPVSIRGRPEGQSAQRDYEIVIDIYSALYSGQPQRSNRKGELGAFATIAKKHDVSEATAARLWRASRAALKKSRERKALDRETIDLSCEPPEVQKSS